LNIRMQGGAAVLSSLRSWGWRAGVFSEDMGRSIQCNSFYALKKAVPWQKLGCVSFVVGFMTKLREIPNMVLHQVPRGTKCP
jgi:hypothetical protein